jgi:hypothetical protein
MAAWVGQRVRVDGGDVKVIMTHGYMLSDTGSNVYVQNLCRALVRKGHEMYLPCQEPVPLSSDFLWASERPADGSLYGEPSSPGRLQIPPGYNFMPKRRPGLAIECHLGW